MGLGDLLSRVGAAMEDYRYTRDFGSNYREGFQSRQDYLNRMAAERQAERELKRQEIERDRAIQDETRRTQAQNLRLQRLSTARDLLKATARPKGDEFELDLAALPPGLDLSPEDLASASTAALGGLRGEAAERAREKAEWEARLAAQLGKQKEFALFQAGQQEGAEGRRSKRGLADLEQELQLRLKHARPPAAGSPGPFLEAAQLLGTGKETPEQLADLAASLAQRWRQKTGGAPGAQMPAATGPVDSVAGGPAPVKVQRNKKTGQVRHSLDGGATWRPGPPS